MAENIVHKQERDNDRPTIVFVRTLNTKQSPREELRENGKLVRAFHPGEFTEEWHKALVPQGDGACPYIWATPDWVRHQIQSGRKPVRVYGLEYLPDDYPTEWRDQILAAFAEAMPFIQASGAVAALSDENEMLKQRLAKLEELQSKVTEETDVRTTKVRGQGKGDRQNGAEAEAAHGAAGEAADAS